MTHTYFFPEPGTISGIPGTFAGVQVEVDEETSEIIKVSPLARHPHFQASQEPDVQAKEDEKPSEQEASPPEQDEAEEAPTEAGHASQATETAPPEQPAQDTEPETSAPTDEAGSHIESEN